MKKKLLILLGIYVGMGVLWVFMSIGAANIEIFGINLMNILIALIISVVIASIYLVHLVKEMNNVKIQPSAGGYIVDGSFKLYAQNDKFLFSNVVKHAKSQNNNSHHGNSRKSRGGGSRSRSRGGGGRSRGGGRRGGGRRR